MCVKEKERVRKRQDRGKTGRIGRSHKTKNTIITFAIFLIYILDFLPCAMISTCCWARKIIILSKTCMNQSFIINVRLNCWILFLMLIASPTGCSGNIGVFTWNFLCDPSLAWAAIGCAENVQPIRVTVHWGWVALPHADDRRFQWIGNKHKTVRKYRC